VAPEVPVRRPQGVLTYNPGMDNVVMLGKWEELVHAVPDQSVSLVLTDPPYGCTPHSWDKRPYWSFFWTQMARICGESGQAWVFVRMPWAIEVYSAAAKAGWRYVQEVVWEKQNGGGATVDTFRKVHENIWHFKRPGASTFNISAVRVPKTTTGDKSIAAGKGYAATQYMKGRVAYVDDGLRMPRSVMFCRNLHQSRESLGHPTQKPIAVVEPLVLYSSNPGELVFDPFAGTGTTLAAAQRNDRRWLGIEMTPEWHAKATARMGGTVDSIRCHPPPPSQNEGKDGIFGEE